MNHMIVCTDKDSREYAAGRLRIVELQNSAATDYLDRMRADVLKGLGARPRSLPSKYFYDAKGSEIFGQISNLPEYYLTRCEREILQAHRDRIASEMAGSPWMVVDLGAGDGSKTRVLLEHLCANDVSTTYAPIDVSPNALITLATDMRRSLPKLDVEAVVAD